MLYVDGRPQKLAITKDSLQGSTHTSAPLEFGRMYPDADPLRQSAFQDFRFFRRALSAREAVRLPIEDYVAEIVQKPMSGWSEDEFHTVSEFYFAQRDEATQKLNAQIAPLNEELDPLSRDGAITLVREEGPGLPYADVLARGAFGARTDSVRTAGHQFLLRLSAHAET